MDDYVRVTTVGSSPLGYYGKGELTVSTWVYVDPAETSGGILVTVTGYKYWLKLNADRTIEFRLNNDWSGNGVLQSPLDKPLSTNSWHHVAATVDESKHMVIYIDGEKVASGDHAISDADWGVETNETYDLMLGTASFYSQADYNTFQGKLDDVRIYKRALSADEVAEMRPSHSYTYDAVGNMTSSTDAAGHTTAYQYDNLGRKTAELAPCAYSDVNGTPTYMRATTQYAYDLAGNMTSTTDPLGNVTRYGYDALNRQTHVTDALGSELGDPQHTTVTAYDALGNVTSLTDSEGNITRYAYDRLNRLIEETDPLSFTTQYSYDADGNLTQKTDRDGRVTQYLYDPLGRTVEEDWLASDGVTVTHAILTYFDADGEIIGVTESDSQNRARAVSYEYAYDRDGRLTESRMAPGDLAQSAGAVYTASGSLDGNSSIVDWNRDGTLERYQTVSPPLNLSAGQTVLVQVTSTAFATAIIVQPPGGSQSNWLIAKASDGNTSWLMFTVGQSQGGDWYFAATSPSLSASGNYTMTITVDANPLVPTALTALDYTYNADGSVHTVTDASNVPGLITGATTTYTYTPLGQVQQIQQSGEGLTSKQVNFNYLADGSTQSVTRYAGSTPTEVATSTYAYDGMGRVSSLTNTHANAPIDNYTSLGYDAASNVTQMVSSVDGTTNYTDYDAVNQLTAATHSTQANESFSYDQNGNRASGYQTGADNRLLSDGTYTYSYDAEGNRIRRTAADSARQRSISGTTATGWRKL